MCGITGYAGHGPAQEPIVEGLSNLEYRGYDSAGIALVDGALSVQKRAGDIADLREALGSSDATRGIGHTRWSTHGRPTDENAHPHTDCDGRVAVVHNGIVENYDGLRDELEDRGHAFTSETDTEVIPHMIEERLDEGDDLRTAVRRTVDRLEGSYAIAAVAEGHEGIVGVRHDSPLVVGHDDEGNFLASDVTAFLGHTNRVTYLEDGDLVHVTADDVTVVDADGTAVDRPIETLEWDAEQAEKGGYEHYMLKEIHEQPRALRQALSGRVDEIAGEVELDLSLDADDVDEIDAVEIVACGTSYHAALYGAEMIEDLVDVPASAEYAHEYDFRARDPRRTLVIAVTQSGETADTLGAIRRASGSGARTLAVTNTLGSTVTREVDDTVFIRAGPEIGVAATKTFASQVTVLAMLAAHLGRTAGALPSTDAADLLDDLRGLPGAVQRILDDEDAVREAAERFAASDAFFYIGRKHGYPVALEGALKLKEISYDHAEGFAAGELKHGPLALVTADTPVLTVLTQGARADATLNNVKEVESREAPVIGVSSIDDAAKYVDVDLRVPSLGRMEPLLANVYLQLFAYHVADSKDRPIDKPRNLAKSVTVE